MALDFLYFDNLYKQQVKLVVDLLDLNTIIRPDVHKIDALISKNDVQLDIENLKCDICYTLYQDKHGLLQYKDRAHFGLRFGCPACEHKATTPGNLKVHIRSVHEKVKSPHNQCKYQAYNSTSLTKH